MNYFRYLDSVTYRRWIKEFDTLKAEEVARLRELLQSRPYLPRVAVVPLAPAASQKDFAAFAQALRTQIYWPWHICVQADIELPHDPALVELTVGTWQELLLGAAKTADFVLPLPLDAELPAHALTYFALALDEYPNAALIYGDEDVLHSGKRCRPRFKTDWDPLLMLGRDLLGIPVLYRSTAVLATPLESVTGSTVENFLFSLGLTVTADMAAEEIQHVPAILCHRTRPPAWNAEDGRKTVRSHLSRRGVEGAKVEPAPLAPQWNRVIFPLPARPPLVSLIIPTRDRAEVFATCLEGLLKRTDYPALELLIVDNGTSAPDALQVLEQATQDARVKLICDNRPFNFSQLNNLAVAQARGEIIVLLNNDTNVVDSGWLTELVSLAVQPDIGIVGAKLHYANFRVQHAGLVFGPNSVILHQLRLLDGTAPGPEGELALLRSVSAVTAACLAMRRDLYIDLGSLNEAGLRVAYNDVDLCTRVAKRGLRIAWTPHARLYHLESVSRGAPRNPDRADREFSENMRFWMTHAARYDEPDPFHNPQIVFRYDHVDLARPPRWHRLRPTRQFAAPAPVLAFY